MSRSPRVVWGIVTGLMILCASVLLADAQTVIHPPGTVCTNLSAPPGGTSCVPPAPPVTYLLTLAQTGTGTCGLSGGGPYPAGAQATPVATPLEDSTFNGWTPPVPILMDADKTAAALCNLKPVPPVGALDWVLMVGDNNPPERTPNWYNLAFDKEGRAYSLNWSGELWRFDPATPTVKGVKVAQMYPSANGQHNCTITGDLHNNQIVVTGQCAPGIDGSAKVYDVATGTVSTLAAAGSRGGANSAGIYDPALKRFLSFAGWLSAIDYYVNLHTLALNPVAPTWITTQHSPAPSPQVPVISECDRFSHNRAGYDTARSRAWIIMANGNLWTYEGTGPWVERVTTGNKPEWCAEFTYHAGLDRIVAWTGQEMAGGTPGAVIRKTRLLDPATLIWQEITTKGLPPGLTPTITAIGYDAVRGQVLLRTGGAYWALQGGGTPPPPVTFPVAVTAAGTGQGTTSGGGSYTPGSTVALGATPAPGSDLTSWTPPPCAASFLMPPNALTCTATFTLVPVLTYPVTITTAGAGQGTTSGQGSYQPGAPVSLRATPNAGSVFAGWTPTPCADSFTMPPNAVACVASFAVAPPPGQITPRVFTPRPVPTTDFSSPFRKGNKDIGTTYNPDTGEAVFCTGDYDELPMSSGHSTCYGYQIATNVWRRIADPCGPTDSITPARPTDRGQFAYNARRKTFLFRSVVDTDQLGSVCNLKATPTGATGSLAATGLLEYDPATKLWTKLHPDKAGVLNEGVFVQGATEAEDIVLHLSAGNTVCSYDGFRMSALNLTTFATTHLATSCWTPTPQYGGGGNGWTGAIGAANGRFAWDAVGQRAFVCGVYYRRQSDEVVERAFRCHRYDHATQTITPLAPPPVLPSGVTPYGIYTSLVYDSVNAVVIMPVVGDTPCAVIQAMHVYTPATDSWEDVPIVAEVGVKREDVRGNNHVYDAPANATVLAGTGFCDPPLSPGSAPLLWRYR